MRAITIRPPWSQIIAETAALTALVCCPPWGEATHNGKPAWHLVLDNVRRLREPVPARGSLAVPWTLPDDVAAQVEQQLAVAS